MRPLSPCLPVCLSTYVEETIREMSPYVRAVTVSDISKEGKMFLNVITLEGQGFTVEQSSLGFQVSCQDQESGHSGHTSCCQVVGMMLNTKNLTDQPFYETPASLLNTISKEYTRAFANHLINRLKVLSEDQFIHSMTSCRLDSEWCYLSSFQKYFLEFCTLSLSESD